MKLNLISGILSFNDFTFNRNNKVFLIPAWPSNRIYELENHVPQAIGFVEMDSILYVKRPPVKSFDSKILFALIETYDPLTWCLIFISILLVLVVLTGSFINNKRSKFSSNSSNKFSLTNLFGNSIYFTCFSPIQTIPVSRFPKSRLLTVVWLIAAFFLVRFFSSDLLNALSQVIPLDKIDNFDELCLRKDLPIKIIGKLITNIYTITSIISFN